MYKNIVDPVSACYALAIFEVKSVLCACEESLIKHFKVISPYLTIENQWYPYLNFITKVRGQNRERERAVFGNVVLRHWIDMKATLQGSVHTMVLLVPALWYKTMQYGRGWQA